MNLSSVNYEPSEHQAYNGYQGKRILTPTAAVKASFHEPDASINVAHSFTSFRAFSGAPLPTHALLRFISRSCGSAGSSNNAAVYCKTASSYCLAFRALFPRSSILLRHLDLKSDTGWTKWCLGHEHNTHRESNVFSPCLLHVLASQTFGGNIQLRP